MLKRTHVRHFIALAETGGFTAAARRLNLTQPTLSASLAELERLVGTPLILRPRDGGRRTMRLTEAGHRLLALARTIEQEFRTAETTLVPGRAPLPPLHLGVLPSLASGMLAELVARFGDERPLELIEGTDAELRRRLADGQVHAALTLLRPGETAGPVLDEGYAMLLAVRHPLAARADLAPEELGGEAMIARRSCELLGETSKFFTARGVRPHFLMRSANEDRCLALVREGFAVTTGPVSLAGPGLVAVPLQGYTFRRRVGLVSSSGDGLATLEEVWGAVLAARGDTMPDGS